MIELADSAPISFRMSFDGKPPIEKSFPVRLAGPADYLEVVDQRFEPAGAAGDGKNKLSVQVKARDPVLDPPAEVHLVVSREGIPGLQVVPKQAEDRVRVGGKPGEVSGSSPATSASTAAPRPTASSTSTSTTSTAR
jgi:hypothetical protein